MGAFFQPVSAIGDRANNDVGSRFWTWKFFAKSFKIVEIIKIVNIAKKSENFERWKIRKYDKVFFWQRNDFHLLRSLRYKNGKEVQNMPVVAGRFAIS